jgi:hypothetical protein
MVSGLRTSPKERPKTESGDAKLRVMVLKLFLILFVLLFLNDILKLRFVNQQDYF